MAHLRPEDALEWLLFAAFAAVALAGAYLCRLAFAVPGKLDRARDFLASSSGPLEVLFALGVALIAIPITMMLRAWGVADE